MEGAHILDYPTQGFASAGKGVHHNAFGIAIGDHRFIKRQGHQHASEISKLTLGARS